MVIPKSPAPTATALPHITPDWLQGWGAVLAAVFSGAAVIIALMLYKHERDARAADIYDATVRQARTVLVAGPKTSAEVTVHTPDGDNKALCGVRVGLINYSDQPVLHVSVTGFHDFSGHRYTLQPEGGSLVSIHG